MMLVTWSPLTAVSDQLWPTRSFGMALQTLIRPGNGRFCDRHSLSALTFQTPAERFPFRPWASYVWSARSQSLALRPSGWVETMVRPMAGFRSASLASAGAARASRSAGRMARAQGWDRFMGAPGAWTLGQTRETRLWAHARDQALQGRAQAAH